MIVAGILAVMWSAGCFGLPLWAAWSLWDDYEQGMAIAVLLIGWPLAVIVGILPWAAYADSQDPHISLNKTEWVCTARHSMTTTTFVMSGKVMVPITSTHQVCDQYNRK
jgi:hypothetical protein